MDESSQGSVELIDGVDIVTPHVEKLGGTMREEYLQAPCIDIHRVAGGTQTGTMLTTDLMQTHIHPQMVEEFNTHGEQEYYEHHILQEHDLADADRQLVELQAVVEEPQNLSAPVTVVGEKVAAMLSAYIQTTGDLTPTHQIIIDSSDRSVKMFQQQRLPSLSSLPPLKKALTNSTIRSRYLRPQTHHSLDEEVTLTPMTNAHHSLDGENVIVGQHIVHEDSSDGHRLMSSEVGHAILIEDPNQRIITQDSQRILVAQDATMSHSLATSSGNHRAGSLNGHHRVLEIHTDHAGNRYLAHQETSVVTSMAGQRLLAAQAHQAHSQVQTQAEMDVAERLLDEESPEHQMLVQEQLIHVVLDQNAQAELGVVVPTPGQRVILQGPEGWTSIDPASCDPETGDQDSRDTTMVEVSDQGLIVKHEEVDIAESMVEEVEDVAGDGNAELSDPDGPVEDLNDSDYDGEGDMRTSRRSLPHKKRLSKKLRNPRKSQSQPPLKSIHAKYFKCNKCGEQFGTQAACAAHKVIHTPSNKKLPAFSCEICGKIIPNQLKFFEHLKAHYEPGANAPSNVRVTADNGPAHQKLVDRNVVAQTVVKEHQHIVQLQQHQPQQHHQHHQPQQKQQQQPTLQHNLHTFAHQEHSYPQLPEQHNQRTVQVHNQHHQDMQTLRQTRHQGELVGVQATQHHEGEMQTMILKVENAAVAQGNNSIATQQSHLASMHQQHGNRLRSLKHDEGSLQSHHQHQVHVGRSHQTQESPLQQATMNSEPPPLVPILPPVSTITGSVNLTCNLCGKHFRRQKTYETHLSVAHPKQEDIEQFSDPEDMMEGIREVVEAGEDSEDETESMARLTSLGAHNAGSLPKSTETWYRDEDLSATEADLQALQHAENEQHHNHAQIQHHTNHHQQEASPELDLNHMCDLCGDTFHTRARLNQHLREEHIELRQKSQKKIGNDESVESPKAKKPLRRLACTQCDRVFNHRNSLVYHLRSHSGERPHQCEECGKSFFATSALKVHMRLHSGDKPYKCDFCGRHFRQWGDLKYHCTSRHSEEKQYQCEYCGKDFARKYSLIVHRRIHTGEKDYVCEFCQKKFRASSYLQNHRRIHTGEKPHRCEVCDKPFRVRSDMKRHLNTHNRDRPRASNTNVSSGPLITNVRGNTHKIEAPDSDVDGDTPDSQDITPMQNIHIHELGTTTITVMKTDSEGMEIIPDPNQGSDQAQTSSTISLSSHTTDEGLQYTSERDPLDNRAHGTTHSGQLVYVLPNYYM